MLEELLQQVANRGWLVHALCQENDKTWSCRLKCGSDLVYCFGHGSTALFALNSAIHDSTRALSWRPKAAAPREAAPRAAAPRAAITTADLLGGL